ncbi:MULTISPECIES: MSMEG_0567/Sll0786 family nitrogen starvation N-acetyltransferase [Enterobacterales]|uniref:MSMEG_0567/Sll0786 family nitrogen starvation N-acetyltransferase n=1 Tax=Enterobacterales TaxID=91347 RepID=UPI000F7F1A78|nr:MULTISPECIES: MSMEG_0567/Sll0786 family nitrogen starvation N-acetyltransferase [Enterobacterales]RSV87624.1 GNAT family N-acetyltransferase [Klebsiella aerogenes]
MMNIGYPEYAIKWVTLPWEQEQAYTLRRRVFCQEQGIFERDDLDDIDRHAHLLVALGSLAGWHEEVVGTVRIHQQQPGVWLGSRLAVDDRFRRQGQLGPMLIRLAVSSANALGCQAFYAHVQAQNEPLFRRMHWHSLGELVMRGIPHVFMQADLTYYPPCYDPNSGMVLGGRARHIPHELAPVLTGGSQ